MVDPELWSHTNSIYNRYMRLYPRMFLTQSWNRIPPLQWTSLDYVIFLRIIKIHKALYLEQEFSNVHIENFTLVDQLSNFCALISNDGLVLQLIVELFDA